MEIRSCTVDDIEIVYELICQLEQCQTDYNKFKNVYTVKLNNVNNHYLLATVDNRAVGFISINNDYQLHHENKVATIEELVTDNNYRGQGIGKSLVEYAILLAKKNNCEIIELTSSFDRVKAHRFYQNNGFDKASYKFKLALDNEGNYEI